MHYIYSSLEQRMAAFYYLTMPQCKPIKNDYCTEKEQENLYNFMYGTYKMLFEDPNILFSSLNEDDGFPNIFNCKSYNKEKLLPTMRKDIKVIDDYLELLMSIGQNGVFNGENVRYDIKISKKYQSLMTLAGLEINQNLITNPKAPFFKALKWFASVENITLRRFSTCSFDEYDDYVSDVLAPLCNSEEGACEKIVKWLKENNYKWVQYQDNTFKIDFVKNINYKEQPVGLSFHGDPNHIGFSMEYRYFGERAFYCTIRILNMKGILNDFENLSSSVQELIISKNKRCDGCRYCVQTDRTKTRPLANIEVNYQEKKYRLCPLFQGFWFSFRDLKVEDADKIIEFLQLLEKYNMK